MKGLLLNDYYVGLKELKYFLILIPVMALFSGGLMSTFAIFIGASIPMTILAYDERSRWNQLVKMMPYSSKEVVLSKFIVGYGSIAVATVLSGIGILLGKVMGIESSFSNLNSVLMTFGAALSFLAINLVVYYKYGSAKGRLVFIVVIMLAGASGGFLGADVANDGKMFISFSSMEVMITLLVGVILNIISINITSKIYESKVI